MTMDAEYVTMCATRGFLKTLSVVKADARRAALEEVRHAIDDVYQLAASGKEDRTSHGLAAALGVVCGLQDANPTTTPDADGLRADLRDLEEETEQLRKVVDEVARHRRSGVMPESLCAAYDRMMVKPAPLPAVEPGYRSVRVVPTGSTPPVSATVRVAPSPAPAEPIIDASGPPVGSQELRYPSNATSRGTCSDCRCEAGTPARCTPDGTTVICPCACHPTCPPPAAAKDEPKMDPFDESTWTLAQWRAEANAERALRRDWEKLSREQDAASDAIRAQARREAIERVLGEAERFASGHHFAGDKAGEASFRRFMERIRSLLDSPAPPTLDEHPDVKAWRALSDSERRKVVSAFYWSAADFLEQDNVDAADKGLAVLRAVAGGGR